MVVNGNTVRVSDTVAPPAEACIVAVRVVETEVVVTANPVLVAPSGTVTDPEMVRYAVPPVSVTRVPPARAGAVSETVQRLDPPPVTDVRLQLSPEAAGSAVKFNVNFPELLLTLAVTVALVFI